MEKESADMCFYMVGWITFVKPLVWALAFYTGLRTKGGGGCEVLHVYLLCHNVGIPGKPLYFPVQAVWLWPDGRMDWHVYGLDHPRRHFTWRFLSGRWMSHKVV